MIRFTSIFIAFVLPVAFLAPMARADLSFSLQVNDKATGEALSGVSVTIGTENSNQKFKTDDAGHVEVTLPGAAPRYFSVLAKLDHYTPVYVAWGSRNNAGAAADAAKIPQTFSISMEPGTRIGGVVKDEKDQPVADATVRLQSFDNGNLQDGVAVNKIDADVKTDAQGKWTIDTAPVKIPPTWIMVQHKDFYNNQVWQNVPPDADLRARTALTTLQHAQTLTGKVVDPAGNPVANAAIAAGEDGWGGPMHKAKSGADGVFSLKSMRPGQALVSVYAKGFAPDIATLTSPATQPAQIQLHPGTPLEFHFQDPKGNPLSNVKISLNRWRNTNILQYQMQTDANGTAIWKDAPSDEMQFDFSKSNWGSIHNRTISAAATQPITITLGAQTKVQGTVVDAITNEPVKSFTVTQGIGWENSPQVEWVNANYGREYSPKTGADGKFTITPGQSYAMQYLRVNAPGYASSVSRALKSDEGDINLEFKLTKAVPLTGTLHTPDGKPVPDTIVFMAIGQGTNVQVHDAQIVYPRPDGSNSTRTDSAGHFTFSRETGPFLILAATPEGIAQYHWPPADKLKSFAITTSPSTEPVAGSIDLVLEPWGRIEGNVKVAGKPGAGETIVTQPLNGFIARGQPTIYCYEQTTADAKGHYVIPHVLPGLNSVARQTRSQSQGRTVFVSSRGESVTVEAGKTAIVDIGGKGRPVIGKLEIPKDLADRKWSAQGRIKSPTKVKLPTPPANVQAAGPAAYVKWIQAWQQSDEGKEFLREQQLIKYFPIVVQPDGVFRAEEVTPGTYEIDVYFMDAAGTGLQRPIMPRQNTSAVFTVADIPNGYTDQPLDLGLVPLKSPSTQPATMRTATSAPAAQINRVGG